MPLQHLFAGSRIHGQANSVLGLVQYRVTEYGLFVRPGNIVFGCETGASIELVIMVQQVEQLTGNLAVRNGFVQVDDAKILLIQTHRRQYLRAQSCDLQHTAETHRRPNMQGLQREMSKRPPRANTAASPARKYIRLRRTRHASSVP